MNDHILTPVSPGEIIDKITILEIKSERITDNDKLKNIRYELAELTAIMAQKLEQDSTLSTLKDQLKTINTTLWDIEDDIRDCERNKDFSETFIKLARAVYITNDDRAAVKKEINVHLGSAIVEEKSYADYK